MAQIKNEAAYRAAYWQAIALAGKLARSIEG